jgi:hypothetical protein
MKARRTFSGLLALGLALILTVGMSAAQGRAPQASSAPLDLMGTGFTYQGYLTDGGSPADDDYDFQFTLYDDGGTPLGTVDVEDHTVNDGLFTVVLDFGPDLLTGDARWLQIGVRPWDSEEAHTLLDPWQELTPAPYALALPGLWTQQLESWQPPNLIGGWSGNWVSDGVWGATIGGGGEDWAKNRVTDKLGTIAGGTDNQAGNDAGTAEDAELATVGGGASNTASGAYSTIGGGIYNTASISSTTIGGGWGNTASGGNATVGGGLNNWASGEWNATIAGGADNVASGVNATIGGGGGNVANGEYNATVGGGYANIARNSDATVGGGGHNTAGGWAATVSGGYSNTVTLTVGAGTIGGGEANLVTNDGATVGGGFGNEVGGYAATVPGGELNTAGGDHSFAAGLRAKANNFGAFVWADAIDQDLFSTADNQFLVRATGGVRFDTGEAPFEVNGIEIGGDDCTPGQVLAYTGDAWECVTTVLYISPQQQVSHTMSTQTSPRMETAPAAPPQPLMVDLTTLGVETEVIEFQDATGSHKIPNDHLVQAFDVVCHEPCPDITTWHHQLLQGTTEWRDIHIDVLDDGGVPYQQWDLLECWPQELQTELSPDGKELYARYSIQCNGIQNVFPTRKVQVLTAGDTGAAEGEGAQDGTFPPQQVMHTVEFPGIGLPPGTEADLLMLHIETEIISHTTGTHWPFQRLGRNRYADYVDLICTQPCPDLDTWHQDVLQDQATARDGSIVVRNQLGAEIQRWNLFECWPSRLGAALSADGMVLYPKYSMTCSTMDMGGP